MSMFGIIPDMPKKGVVLRMTAGEARAEAIGKALGLVGTTMGAIGTVMALTANPVIKQSTEGVYTQLPPEVQQNKIWIIMGVSAFAAILLARRIKSVSEKNAKERYQ